MTLYPLEKTITGGGAAEEVIEKTDIGGPTLCAPPRRDAASFSLRSSSTNLKTSHGHSIDDKYLVSLAAAAERRVADYVATSADYWERRIEVVWRR